MIHGIYQNSLCVLLLWQRLLFNDLVFHNPVKNLKPLFSRVPNLPKCVYIYKNMQIFLDMSVVCDRNSVFDRISFFVL